MLLCHFKTSFKQDKLNFRFIGTLRRDECSEWRVLIRWNALASVLSRAIPGKGDEFLSIWNQVDIYSTQVTYPGSYEQALKTDKKIKGTHFSNEWSFKEHCAVQHPQMWSCSVTAWFTDLAIVRQIPRTILKCNTSLSCNFNCSM